MQSGLTKAQLLAPMAGHVLEDVRAIQRVRRPHLLLALLRDPAKGLADLLAEKGVTVDWLRERLAAGSET